MLSTEPVRAAFVTRSWFRTTFVLPCPLDLQEELVASGPGSDTGYRSIARRIECEIDDGTPNQKLASERALAERFDCQRGTVRRALQLLESRGLIYRRDRSGWYTTPASLDYILTGSPPLAELTAQLGRELRTEVLTTVEPPGHQPPDGMVFAVRRRRRLDGWPIVAEDIHVKADLGSRIESCDMRLSTKSILASVGIEITFEQATLEVLAAPDWVGEVLGLGVVGSVLRVIRQRYVGDRLVQSDTEWWRSRAVRLHVGITGGEVRTSE